MAAKAKQDEPRMFFFPALMCPRLLCACGVDQPVFSHMFVLWREASCSGTQARFQLAITDDWGYLHAAEDHLMIFTEAVPVSGAALRLVEDVAYEFYFVRHPDPCLATTIKDDLAAGSKSWGPPMNLSPRREVTGHGEDGNTVEELVLRVPAGPASFVPKGASLYGGWLLYRDMPHGSCAAVRAEIARLQNHLGGLRYLVGNDSAPYEPVPFATKGSARFPNEGVFDIPLWNAVLLFQRHVRDGEAAMVARELYGRLFRDDPPLTPTRAPPARLGKDKAAYVEFGQAFAQATQAAPGKRADVVDNGVVDEVTAENLRLWIVRGYRKPGRILVPRMTGDINAWVIWMRDDALAPVDAWHKELKRLGFKQGVAFVTTFRDARDGVTSPGRGMVSLSIHKSGLAFDLFEVNYDGTSAERFDIHYVREVETIKGKERVRWIIYGQADISKEFEAALATRQDGADSSPNSSPAPPDLSLYVKSIQPWQYDEFSTDGGVRLPDIKADPGTAFLNITAVAAHQGFTSISAHDKGWTGSGELKVVLENAASFELLVTRRGVVLALLSKAITARTGAAFAIEKLATETKTTENPDKAKAKADAKADAKAEARAKALDKKKAALDATQKSEANRVAHLSGSLFLPVLEASQKFHGAWLELTKAFGPTPAIVLANDKKSLKLWEEKICKLYPGVEFRLRTPGAGDEEAFVIAKDTPFPRATPCTVRPVCPDEELAPGHEVVVPGIYGDPPGMEWWHYELRDLFKSSSWASLLYDIGWTPEGLGGVATPGPYGQLGLGYSAVDLEKAATGGSLKKHTEKPGAVPDSSARPKPVVSAKAGPRRSAT